MNTKEKAQAYDEIVQRVKELHEAGNALTKKQMEIVLPELAESEDERMIKAILSAIRGGLDTEKFLEKHGTNYEEVEAYLEKQKEQKPADEQFPPLEGLDAIKAKYYDDGFKNGFDEGVASVKPAEWSEEDEKMRQHIVSDLREFRDCETDEELISDYENEITWLKSLRPSWKPSEEQMRSLRDTIINTKGYSYSMYLPELYEQLKKLGVKEEPEYYQHFDPNC